MVSPPPCEPTYMIHSPPIMCFADIPDDKLDNFEQFIADINSTISKLNEIKQEPTT